MAFQITNITDEPSQRHVLLAGDEEIIFILSFYQVTQMWAFDVEWRGVRVNGFMVSLGCLHIQALNWPFDFFCSVTDGSGIAPFRIGDFSEGRCEMYIALQEEIEAPTSTTAMFPVINVPAYTGPSLLADFVGRVYKSGEAGSTPQTKAFPDVVSLTRPTTATYVNSAGIIVTADVDSPRFEYDPVTGEFLGLLIEEQRTNLFIDSGVTLGSIGTAVTPNAAIAPDGSMTMGLVTEQQTSGEHYARDRSLTLTAGVTYTFSVFVKDGPSANRDYHHRVAGAIIKGFLFNPRSKEITGSSFDSAGFVELPDGVFRVWGTYTPASTGNVVNRSQLWNGTSAYTGDGTSGIYIWGAQLEQGPLPTSYIPTAGARVTRAADAVLMPNGPWRTTPDGTLASDADAGVTVALTTQGISVSGTGHVRSVSYTPNA